MILFYFFGIFPLRHPVLSRKVTKGSILQTIGKSSRGQFFFFFEVQNFKVTPIPSSVHKKFEVRDTHHRPWDITPISTTPNIINNSQKKTILVTG